jgi:amino acid transporter
MFSCAEAPAASREGRGDRWVRQLLGFTTSPDRVPRITAYFFLIGLLLAQYTITGYDASAHMTEETHDAAVSGPAGIWKSIVISGVLRLHPAARGALRDAAGGRGTDRARSSSTRSRRTSRAGSIFRDSLGKNWAIFVLLIVIGAQFFCGMASVTANSRMIYAFSP